MRQRPGSARRRRPRGSDRTDLRLGDARAHPELHLRRTSRPGRALRRGAARAGRRTGRPRGHLSADDSRGRHRDARVCATRCGALGGVRRLRGQGARSENRRRRAGAADHRERWVRAGSRHRIPPLGAARPDAHDREHTGRDRKITRGHSRRTRVAGLGHPHRRRIRRTTGFDGGDGSAVHPLHVWYDGQAQGRGARQRRSCRRVDVVDAQHLRRECRSGDVDGLRRRVGGGTLVHRLRPAVRRCHNGSLRGQACRDSRCRRVLAGDSGPQCAGPVHRTDRATRHSQGRSARRRAREIRHVLARDTVRRR